jgi:signal transduction histidine kinase
MTYDEAIGESLALPAFDDRDHYRILAELSSVLFFASLDIPDILTLLVSHVVPTCAPCCDVLVDVEAGRYLARVRAGERVVVETASDGVALEPADPSTMIEVALGRRGQTWGVMRLLEIEPSDELQKLGDELGRRAAIALDNALLYRAEQHARRQAEERARRVTTLANVTRDLARAVTVAEIADVTVARAATAAGAVNAVLFLLDEIRENLDMVRSFGYSRESLDGWERVPLTRTSALTESTLSGEPIWLRTSSAFVERYPWLAAVHRATGNQAAAAVPLLIDGRAIGVLGLSFVVEQSFDEEDREFIGGLVDQCATAIERARLFDRATRANRTKDEFLAVLSHELRTPLAPVLPAIEVIEEEPLSEAGRAMTEIIRRNIRLETRLIDDLLDVARVVNGKLVLHREPVDLHATIRSVLEICQGDLAARRLSVALELRARRAWVDGDPTRLQQALWNLVKNAIKFSEPEGSIAITTSDEGEGIRVVVRDHGMGIEPEMLVRIFDPFIQGNPGVHKHFGGMGLGLAITKAVVDLHGGSLIARSEGRGKGASFTITLASEERRTTDVPRADMQLTQELAGTMVYRVLLVDDHEDTSFVLKKMLERSGFRVTTANSCAAARQLAALGEFDVLVSDLGLPDGTGYDLLADIMLIKHVPAIAISGFGTDQDISRSRAVGFRSHLTKPVPNSVLVETIRRVLA